MAAFFVHACLQSIGTKPSPYAYMNDAITTTTHAALPDRLNAIAWPIKCHWAKHFPIQVLIDDDVGMAGMDFSQVYVHPDLAGFDDDTLFCILAHEWAHRMVSPKSHQAGRRIFAAVAGALDLEPVIAQFIAAPAIELIVDRSNAEVAHWGERYTYGFNAAFRSIVQQQRLKERRKDQKRGERAPGRVAYQMILALRMANMLDGALPAYITALEDDARALIATLFEDWRGYDDADDPDHIRKIIRFSKAFYDWLPQELLQEREQLLRLLKTIARQLDMLSALLASRPDEAGATRHKGKPSGSGAVSHSQAATRRFDLGLTRQVTDHLMQQSHKPRQITGLWQPGHPFSQLDLKRSVRCAPKLIPGMTTRRKTDSARIRHIERGRKLKLCLVVDDSGSMGGDEARFSRSICEGVNRFAAFSDIHLGLITFGSDIDICLPPQRRYGQLTRALSKLDGNLGGTNLKPSLAQLLQFIASDPEISHAMLITDASFSDWDACLPIMNALLAQIRMTVLMINSEIDDAVLEAARAHPNAITAFRIDPNQPPAANILEEIIR